MINLGCNLKRLRSKRNLTQKELAAAVGCSQGVICKMEMMVGFGYNPNMKVVVKLAKYFNTSIERLLK